LLTFPPTATSLSLASTLPAGLAQTVEEVFVILGPEKRRPGAHNELERRMRDRLLQRLGCFVSPTELPQCRSEPSVLPATSRVVAYSASRHACGFGVFAVEVVGYRKYP
jgi:hypothetical protein